MKSFIILSIYLSLMFGGAVHGTTKPPKPDPAQPAPVNVRVDVDADASARASSGSRSTSVSSSGDSFSEGGHGGSGHATATGGDTTALGGSSSANGGTGGSVGNTDASASQDQQLNVGGASFSSKSESNTFVFASDLPQYNSDMCQVNGAVGGSGDGVGAFIQWPWMNDHCWAQKLAATERDVNLQARLKCDDSKYRRAIAYEYRKPEQRAQCIRMVTESGEAYIASLNERRDDHVKRMEEELSARRAAEYGKVAK